jgi:hypothetical protein
MESNTMLVEVWCIEDQWAGVAGEGAGPRLKELDGEGLGVCQPPLFPIRRFLEPLLEG